MTKQQLMLITHKLERILDDTKDYKTQAQLRDIIVFLYSELRGYK